MYLNPQKVKIHFIESHHFLCLAFKQPDETSFKIATNILDFILHEVDHGSKFYSFNLLSFEQISFKGMPKKLLPFQSGVGNVANAVLAVIGK